MCSEKRWWRKNRSPAVRDRYSVLHQRGYKNKRHSDSYWVFTDDVAKRWCARGQRPLGTWSAASPSTMATLPLLPPHASPSLPAASVAFTRHFFTHTHTPTHTHTAAMAPAVKSKKDKVIKSAKVEKIDKKAAKAEKKEKKTEKTEKTVDKRVRLRGAALWHC